MEKQQTFPNEISFTVGGRLKCGSYEAEVRKYKLIGDKYLVAIQPNEADNIYVKGGANSDGFGGRMLSFELENGEILNWKAPWHTNSTDLYNSTGYDVRDKSLTQGICALNKGKEKFNKPTIYKNILHYDGSPVVGTFSRVPDIAQELANNLNSDVWYAVTTSGGGSSGYKKPIVNNKVK